MEEGLLSIIIPVYNGKLFLDDTLESLSKVSYDKTEFIIVDDGSGDESVDICRKFMQRDSRFKLVQQENKGIAEARNTGLRNAKGEYIGFCDQDDLVEKDFYKLAVEKIRKDDSTLCICSVKKFYDKENKGSGSYFELQKDALTEGRDNICRYLIMPALLQAFSLVQNEGTIVRPSIWNCIIKRESITVNKLQFKRNVNFEDDLLMRLDLLLSADRVSTIKHCGYYWRTNIKSESHTLRYIKKLPEKQMATRNYIKEKLTEHELYEQADMYMRYAMCYDLIKIIENERAVKRRIRERKKYLELTCRPLNSKEVKKCAKDIKKGEIRYRAIWFWLGRDNYIMAVYTDSVLRKLILFLNKLKVANRVDDIVQRQCGKH
jgi:glycosyltransferase involved in cell wall biosynthesis